MPHDPTVAALRAALSELTLRDERRLGQLLRAARSEAGQAAVAERIEAARLVVDARRAAVPELRYPQELPVSQRRADLLAAIGAHQVVIVAGETGSGKTTQLPKLCLELGRGVRGLIGHTQPRRLAARTVAERIAEEVGTPLGETIGYQVRFTDRVGERTLVKLMTDGILLNELQRDRDLRGYDTLIVDEAHERSLNVDFILGYLKQLLPRRPDLKVVITSATIDPERFSRHFGDAPIVEVSGRTYPVEVRYRPLLAEPVSVADSLDDPDWAGDTASSDVEDAREPRDVIQAIGDAVDELAAAGPGDVLVFLSGEREIRDTAEALRRRLRPDTEILPLYARLSTAEQHRVFAAHPGRRIVLATNVAETSLTVPGIRYVIDPGTARISRYSRRTKVQRLPIEAVSQASANQRKGRCGRTSAGVCIRLYSEQDFLSRPEFTEPEILRTNLASVILQMTAIGLGNVAAFPFIDPPDRRQIGDGVALLQELGALEEAAGPSGQRLTALGRRLAQVPADPRLARMVLAAGESGCLREVLVIASALSIQDPRERPIDRAEAARASHARFADPDSDFVAYLNLWKYLAERRKELSSNGFRRMCRDEFLNFLRIREWQDLHSQLRQVAKTLGASLNTEPAAPQVVQTALLTGLLSHIGLKDPDKHEYAGARGARFALLPGSALFRKPPRWVVAAELVETSRLWGRICARIEPEWVEPLATHLVKRSYSEPHWEAKQGSAVAYEKVTLYGMPIVASRKVYFGRIDPALSRELFIRHALVEGDWRTRHEFFHANRALLEEVSDLENRARRRDILVDDETLFDFYDQRLPADVVSAAGFDSWWRKARRDDPEQLSYSTALLVNERAAAVRAADYPDTWVDGELALPLTYQFEPGTAADGVTVRIPVALLPQVPAERFEWQVPGLRRELLTALIRSLPKPVRRHFVPVPDYVAAVLERAGPDDGPLLSTLEDVLGELARVRIDRDLWQLDRVPEHLRMTFRVLDAQGATLAEGKDLAALGAKLTQQVRDELSAATPDLARTGLREWSIGTLPPTVAQRRGGVTVTGYPALVDEGGTVGVKVLATAPEQWRSMWLGTRRLLLLGVPPQANVVSARLSNAEKLALTRNPHGGVAALLADCTTAALDKLVAEAGGPAWDAEAFETLRRRVAAELSGTLLDTLRRVEPILTAAHTIEQSLRTTTGLPLVAALTDIRSQLSGLVYAGFVAATGWWKLPDILRYLQAIERRLAKLPEQPQRDREKMERIAAIRAEYDRLRASRPPSDQLTEIRWMIEELRVHTFAQNLGTPQPISEVRIHRALDAIP